MTRSNAVERFSVFRHPRIAKDTSSANGIYGIRRWIASTADQATLFPSACMTREAYGARSASTKQVSTKRRNSSSFFFT